MGWRPGLPLQLDPPAGSLGEESNSSHPPPLFKSNHHQKKKKKGPGKSNFSLWPRRAEGLHSSRLRGPELYGGLFPQPSPPGVSEGPFSRKILVGWGSVHVVPPKC